jgi:hypothetical protein
MSKKLYQQKLRRISVKKIITSIAILFLLMHGQVYAGATCSETYSETYLIGDKDEFQSGDQVDIPTQSQLVRDIIASRAPEDNDVPLDIDGANRPVGLTFYFDIPENAQLLNAQVEFKFKGTSSLVDNDGILYEAPGHPVILLRDLYGSYSAVPSMGVPGTATIDLLNVPVRTDGDHPFNDDDYLEYRNLRPDLLDGQFDMVFLDDMMIDYAELTLTYCNEGESSLESGQITIDTTPGHEDRDHARFKMTNMVGLAAAATELDPVDVYFSIENSDTGDIVYEFPTDGEQGYITGGNTLRFMTDDGDKRVTCRLAQELCVIFIERYTDLNEDALYDDVPLTLTLEINGTEFSHSASWSEAAYPERAVYTPSIDTP